MALRNICRLHCLQNIKRNSRLILLRCPGKSKHGNKLSHSRGMRTSAAMLTSAGALANFSWLSDAVPAFGITGKNVEVIHEPQDFYQTLKEEASKAKHRIVLSSLYIGTGTLEKDLVNVIYSALARNPELEVEILLDYTRGSRGEHNSRTLLLPLLKGFEGRVKVALYHTPDLRGMLKTLIPERYNETIGVQHMKVYLFDDNLIMSGANLSDSYFTNRQDRYTLLRNCPHLCDFFHDLVATVSDVSFQLSSNDTVSLLPDMVSHPYNDGDNGIMYKKEVSERVTAVMDKTWYKDYACFPADVAPSLSQEDQSDSSSNRTPARISQRRSRTPVWSATDSVDTWVFPLVQMGPFNIKQDEEMTTALFSKLPGGSVISLASGYFNLTEHYMNTIVQNSTAQYEILTAAPKANGFYGGSGISGLVPLAYTCIAKGFRQRVISAAQQSRISLFEYFRPGWTFHAKGLWGYLPSQSWPCLTFIGSPNFGFRSVYRDIEVQIAIVTENEHLQKQLYEEQQALFHKAEEVTDETLAKPDRATPLWSRLVTHLIKNFF